MPKNYRGVETSSVCLVGKCGGSRYYAKGLCHKHYFRKLRTGSALTKVNPARQVLAKKAEVAVRDLLISYGRYVSFAPHYMSDFDLIVDNNILVDVKCSTLHRDRYGFFWFVNFSHWGSLDESGKDFYILRLEPGDAMEEGAHLLFRAPIGKPTLRINASKLLDRYSSHISDFYSFARGEYWLIPESQVA